VSGEKTEQPTPKRLKKAREEGRVARSADLTSSAVLVVLFLILLNMDWSDIFRFSAQQFLIKKELSNSLKEAHYIALKFILMVVLPVLVTGIIIGALQGGGVIAFKTLLPQGNKLNPINRLKQIFSKKNAFEFVKMIIKFVLIISLFGFSIISLTKVFHYIPYSDIRLVPRIIINLSSNFIKPLLIFIIVVGVLDYFYQRRSLTKELMMTKEEVKEEFKQDEGNPEIKGRRRQLHQEIAMHSLREAVRKASFVVINPEHIAVAVKYNENEDNAPCVVSKGYNKIALEIIRIARENHIPVMRNIPLAHALFRTNEGEEIPEELYNAVAEILIQIERNRENNL
jgi:flagellar biosynthetic protein FlhB